MGPNQLNPVKGDSGGNHKSRETNLTQMCCVFRPANGCSAPHSLIKIDFLMLKQLFPSLTEQNKQFFALFYTFYDLKVSKKLFKSQKLILTSKRHAEQPFAGRNTQHKCNPPFSLPLLTPKLPF